MSTNLKIGLACVLALGLAACGAATSDADSGVYTPQPDAYIAPTPDAYVAPTPTDPYIWVVIQDTEQVACTTNGPGADIDAVALVANTGAAVGTVLGYGKIGSASYKPNPAGYACENTDCSGQNCKYAANGSTFPLADLVARTEGPVDAVVNASTNDVGYFSLNAGTLQLQIGDLTGAGPAQAIQEGDQIQVYEVDKTYVADGYAPQTCSCMPEHYTVFVQTAAGATLQLTPTYLDPSNTTCATLAADPTEGCGSTLFVVP